MSILKSTNSGEALVKPDGIDYQNADFHLIAGENKYKFKGSDSLFLEVEFNEQIPFPKTFTVKNAICPLWRDGIEYRMYINTRKELELVVDYFELCFYNSQNNLYTSKQDVERYISIANAARDKLIEIAQEQWKQYKEQKFSNRK